MTKIPDFPGQRRSILGKGFTLLIYPILPVEDTEIEAHFPATTTFSCPLNNAFLM